MTDQEKTVPVDWEGEGDNLDPDFEAFSERKRGRRHPLDFEVRPSDEQMESFKRGAR